MGVWVPPGVKANGQILFSEDLNAIVTSLQSFLNNPSIGNINFSASPAEKLSAAKVDFTVGATHGPVHLHTGVDPIFNFNVALHATRHASGGADPLAANSIAGSMLQNFLIGNSKLERRRTAEINIARMLGLTFASQAMTHYDLSVASGRPVGNGVVRNGKVYFGCTGYAPDAVVQVDFSVDPPVETVISLTAGDEPNSLVLIGTDIYVLCGGNAFDSVNNTAPVIRKIDINNVVTQIVLLNDAASPAPNDLDQVLGLTVNADATQLYCIGKRSGIPRIHVLIRVPVSGSAASILKVDLVVDNALSIPWLVKRGTTERLIVVAASSLTTDIVHRRNADLTAIDSFQIDSGIAGRSRAAYDGNYLLTLNSAGNGVRFADVWAQTMFYAAQFNAIEGGVAAIDLAEIQGPQFFDGLNSYFGVRTSGDGHGVVLIVPAGMYGAAHYLKIRSVSAQIRGFASDGTYLYVTSGSGTASARVTRMQV